MKIRDPIATYDLIGHQAIEQQLLDAWNKGTLSHSLLFCGTQGVGKATMAFRLARYILSGGAGNGGALFGSADLSTSPESPTAHRIEAGSHGDLLVIRPDEKGATATIKIDEIRKIGHFLALTPAESQWRIVIIDAADDMNANAANALLKLLEEPPSYCFIILISHASGKLLPTIRSRCHKIDFQAHDSESFFKILSQSKVPLSEQERAMIYGLSYGSPGLALRLLDQDAPALYDCLTQLFESYPDPSQQAVDSLLKRLTNPKDKQVWDTWRHVWEWWLYRVHMAMYEIECAPISEIEGRALRAWCEQMSPDQLAHIKTLSQSWFVDTQILHLDRKQVIHSLLNTIAA